MGCRQESDAGQGATPALGGNLGVEKLVVLRAAGVAEAHAVARALSCGERR